MNRRELALTAHDCLTLLAIMVRCADAMRHPEVEDDFLEFRRAAERMDHVAQHLIAPQRTEMATPAAIELDRLVAASEGMLKRAIAPGISLRLQLDAPGSRLRARRWDLERILLHVVINAARGIASGAVVIETSFSSDVRSSVSLIVTGSASAPARLARVNLRRSVSDQDESDLGLAAVARLVQRLNGVLHFESDSEHRTRIQVDFLLASGDSEDHAV